MSFASTYRAAIGAPTTTSRTAATTTASRTDTGKRGDESWGNAAGVCEATFEALRIKAIQPGPSPRVIELATPFPPGMAIAGERLAELYTQRFGGTYRVTGMDGRVGDDDRIILLVQIQKR